MTFCPFPSPRGRDRRQRWPCRCRWGWGGPKEGWAKLAFRRHRCSRSDHYHCCYLCLPKCCSRCQCYLESPFGYLSRARWTDWPLKDLARLPSNEGSASWTCSWRQFAYFFWLSQARKSGKLSKVISSCFYISSWIDIFRTLKPHLSPSLEHWLDWMVDLLVIRPFQRFALNAHI